ncbi:MAG: deoxyribodipyrimidine photo-lyase [Phycisphaera sp.]|nr:MAG: deoxyribodipyrimidine photo-lyase [Phycisphaera sp.]
MRALVWFRSDLRLADNPALHDACRDSDQGVVAVYAVTPEQWAAHDDAPIKVGFRLRNLAMLSGALAEKNIALRIIECPRFEGVPAMLRAMAQEHGCDAIYFNNEYEVNERERDERVIDVFEEDGRGVHRFTDQCAFDPGELRTGKGGYYTVYSPFKRSWYRAYKDDTGRLTPLPVPRKRAEMIGKPDRVPQAVTGFEPPSNAADIWPAGEKEASRRLGNFLADKLLDYNEDRDFPDTPGTSALSPYLVSGAVSLRTCYHKAIEANNGKVDSGSKGAVHWISELIWREFYKHLLVGFQRLSRHRAFKLETEELVWSDNDEHHEAWCEGRTGVPIVDAAMRQLTETGWMHNRLRMIVAMFYTKNLFLDWRRGERFFMRHLIDGDLSANNGGWQWSASTGTDAAPYFRIFNPHSQSKKFDPEGAFIRRFVPELRDVDGGSIHDPGQIPGVLRSALGYPDPIVDVKVTRQAAIDAFQTL